MRKQGLGKSHLPAPRRNGDLIRSRYYRIIPPGRSFRRRISTAEGRTEGRGTTIRDATGTGTATATKRATPPRAPPIRHPQKFDQRTPRSDD